VTLTQPLCICVFVCHSRCLMRLVYVAFDILYDENQSLINLPLRVRQQRLAAAVKCLPADPSVGVLLGPDGGCMRGRIVTLLPNLPVPLPVDGGCSEGLGAIAVGMSSPQFQVRRFCGGSLRECGELECCRGRRRAEFANWGRIATLLPNQLAHPLVSVRGLGAQCVVACMYVGRICPRVRALICLKLSRLSPPPLVHVQVLPPLSQSVETTVDCVLLHQAAALLCLRSPPATPPSTPPFHPCLCKCCKPIPEGWGLFGSAPHPSSCSYKVTPPPTQSC
jgi:hypothetical protein